MIETDYDRMPVKPILDAEPCYEDHPVRLEARTGPLLGLGRAEGCLLVALRRVVRPHLRRQQHLPVLDRRRPGKVRRPPSLARGARPSRQRPYATRSRLDRIAPDPESHSRSVPDRIRFRDGRRSCPRDPRHRLLIRSCLSAGRRCRYARPLFLHHPATSRLVRSSYRHFPTHSALGNEPRQCILRPNLRADRGLDPHPRLPDLTPNPPIPTIFPPHVS